MDIKENYIESFQEKPKYTYFSNGGIYLIKKELIEKIPENEPFSATDLMQLMLTEKRKLELSHTRAIGLTLDSTKITAKLKRTSKEINFENK